MPKNDFHDEMMQTVNKFALGTEQSRERILHLIRTMSNNFGVMVPGIPESYRKLEEEVKNMFSEKEKRAREKKEYREYLNRINKKKGDR